MVWDMATPIHLHMTYDCFHVTTAGLNQAETVQSTKSEVVPLLPFAEEVCWPSNSRTD